MPTFRRDICFLGASNLSGITSRDHSNVQVDSFPGMKLAHLVQLLNSYVPPSKGFTPRHLVFAVGSNDRSNSANTIRIQIDKVLNLARQLFPSTSVHIAGLHPGAIFTHREKESIRFFNTHTSSKWPEMFLPIIPVKYFATTTDGIHWTKSCANATLRHWLQALN